MKEEIMKGKDGTMTLKQLLARADQSGQHKNTAEMILSDLKTAFQRDMTDERACRYAGISKDTYYRWRNLSDEFAEEIDKAKDFLLNASENVIAKAITEGDKQMVTWYKERRDKARFSPKLELENSGNITIKIADGD